jgi:hypothetical protein
LNDVGVIVTAAVELLVGIFVDVVSGMGTTVKVLMLKGDVERPVGPIPVLLTDDGNVEDVVAEVTGA